MKTVADRLLPGCMRSLARGWVADYYRRLLRDPEIIHLDDVYVAVLPDLDTWIMEQELANYLCRVIIALTPDQQQVVVLRFAEDQSIKEVARIMCKQPNAVKQLQHRALRQIEGRLERSGYST
jgi:RNA polymerase sigma-70 factor (ECF subfamily)